MKTLMNKNKIRLAQFGFGVLTLVLVSFFFAVPTFSAGRILDRQERTTLQQFIPEATLVAPAKPGGGHNPEATSASTGCIPTSNYVGPGLNSVQGTVNGTTKSLGFTGVIYVTINSQTKSVFCINLLNPIGPGDCFNSDGSTTPQLTWLLQNYPPDPSQSAFENAARQSAVWYYSDGFVATAPTGVSEGGVTFLARVSQIITAVPADPGATIQPPVMNIDPPSAVNILPDNTEQSFTLTVTRGGAPVANQTVNLSTTFGTLGSPSVTTNASGQATFTVTSASTGTANVTAQFDAAIMAGTVFEPVVANKQKLILGETVTAPIVANSSSTWITGGTVIAHKFMDLNANGSQDAGEPNLANWEMKLYRWNGSQYILQSAKTTNANGDASYSVTDGSYRLTETLPSPQSGHLNWFPTTPGGLTQDFTIANSESRTITFGNLIYSVIVVEKFYDVNGNGQQDDGDTLLNNWDFRLDKMVGSNWVTIQTGTTKNGQIVFSDLPAAHYRLFETVLSGWQITAPATNPYEFDLAVDQSVTVKFGNTVTATSSALNTFSAKAKKSQTVLSWQTGTELDVTGFNLWRKGARGDWKKLNRALIPATHPGNIQGGEYKYTDKSVKQGKTYFYKLELINGNTTLTWSDEIQLRIPAK